MGTHTRRLTLEKGDIVSIVGETEDSEWGSGLARAWAQVHGHSGNGWYAGMLEDGSPVEFHEDQIEGLLDDRPGLSGIRDWFGKKVPTPGPTGLPALPEDPGGAIIYVGPTGIARYEEAAAAPQKPKGFLNAIKESVSSIVDAFKGATGLAPRPEMPMAPYEKKPSMFAAFAPDAPKPLQAWQERATAFMVPKGPGPLAPFVESAKELFSYVEPSPEPESYEARTARQTELWSSMFPQAKEGPSLFEAFKPSEVIMAEDAVLPPEMTKEIEEGKIGALVIPLPPRTTVLPTPEDVARGLMMLYDPIEEKIFNMVRTERQSEEFQAGAAMCMDMGDPAGIKIDSVAGSGYLVGLSQDEDMALAALLQIPWDYIESRTQREWVTYGKGRGRERHLEVVNQEELAEEIFWPAKAIVTEAFNLIKPDDLPGTFEIYEHPDYAHLALMYLECNEQPSGEAPGEGPGEAFEGDPGEGNAVEAFEWTPERMRGRLNELADKAGKLNPEGEEYEELLEEIETEAKEIRDYIVETGTGKVVKNKKSKKKTKKAKKAKKR